MGGNRRGLMGESKRELDVRRGRVGGCGGAITSPARHSGSSWGNFISTAAR